MNACPPSLMELAWERPSGEHDYVCYRCAYAWHIHLDDELTESSTSWSAHEVEAFTPTR
jgi:hypothetical protein